LIVLDQNLFYPSTRIVTRMIHGSLSSLGCYIFVKVHWFGPQVNESLTKPFYTEAWGVHFLSRAPDFHFVCINEILET